MHPIYKSLILAVILGGYFYISDIIGTNSIIDFIFVFIIVVVAFKIMDIFSKSNKRWFDFVIKM